MESWRKIWREGIAPQLPTKGLESLARALARDDGRLKQGCTTEPPSLQCVLDWPVEGACPVGWCGWRGEGLETVDEVHKYFAKVCFEADGRVGESAAVRHFLNWCDDMPREEMRRELLAEVRRVLDERVTGLTVLTT